jgi:hypothetical protein
VNCVSRTYVQFLKPENLYEPVWLGHLEVGL